LRRAATGRRSVVGGAAWRLLRRLLRRRPRSSAGRPRRAVARFGYDPESYSRNFDDGIGSGHRFLS
jgi:hypothetical protein